MCSFHLEKWYYHHSIRLVYKLIWAKHNILPCKSSYCSYSRHRTVQLERLAALFPQPITFESRRRNLQRFLKLPQLRVKLLWLPLIKHIIKQEFSRKNKNRHQRRKLKKLRHLGHLLLVIDRTDWKGRNLFVASVICGKRALPVYWILLDIAFPKLVRYIYFSSLLPKTHNFCTSADWKTL